MNRRGRQVRCAGERGVHRWEAARVLASNPWMLIAAALACGLVAAATADAPETADPVGAANAFRPHELIRAAREEPPAPRIEYRLLWPEAGEPPEALAAVRAAVWRAWAEDPQGAGVVPPPPPPEEVGRAMAQLADRVTEHFQALRRAHPQMPGPGHDVRRVDMVARVEPWLSVTVRREWFFGGAHPNRQIRHFVFDLDTGRELTAGDLFGPAGREEFARRVRRALLAERAGSPDASPENAGLFPAVVIAPTNFCVDHRGFAVTFNEGEVAPRAIGPITVRLSRSELEDLLRGAAGEAPR
ncbi:MAG: RsiV family protein [Kiritimatiellae bacterium]|nr:RsiV family protein [Kiritimatiellia bacterium]